MASSVARKWCAIYTRKSSEEGLEQEFNSLDAQREAGSAYIKSQAHEGWRELKDRYDDGGYSGGNLERPALTRLLEAIRGSRVHTIVVYKVDRLTRSLRDFAKLIDVFETYDVSFVSVTQQFNTTTSMGRLMLNVLLSFAQFEREVTGERIRDKIAASKKKGMWMGGVPPMGYEARDKKLVVNKDEAAVVEHIYRRYGELGCISELVRELKAQGCQTKRYVAASGRVSGGRPFSRGHVHRILTKRIYLGEVVHNGVTYPGEHDAIVDQETWGRTRALLSGNKQGSTRAETLSSASLLQGLLYDDAGNRMSPSHARRGERRYRYYVSQAVIQNRRQDAGSIPRLPAHDLEKLVIDAVAGWLARQAPQCPGESKSDKFTEAERYQRIRRVIERIVVGRNEVRVGLTPEASVEEPLPSTPGSLEPRSVTLRLPYEVIGKGGHTRIVGPSGTTPTVTGPDPALLKAVARAFSWKRQLLAGQARSISEIARQSGVTRPYVTRIIRLAFLAPDLVEAILDGKHSVHLNLERFRDPIPLDWTEQRLLFSRPAPQS